MGMHLLAYRRSSPVDEPRVAVARKLVMYKRRMRNHGRGSGMESQADRGSLLGFLERVPAIVWTSEGERVLTLSDGRVCQVLNIAWGQDQKRRLQARPWTDH